MNTKKTVDQKTMQRRFEFAKTSLAIEGLRLASEDEALFQKLIAENRTPEEIRDTVLRRSFPSSHG